MIDLIATHPFATACVVIGGIFVLWVARPYVREVLITLAGAPARVTRGAALRLRAESRRIDKRYRARMREHQRQELEERLGRLQSQLDTRLQGDINRADATLMRLRDRADFIIEAADEADPRRISREVVADLTKDEDGKRMRGAAAVAKAQERIEAAAKRARDRARHLKPDARRIVQATDRLRLVESKLSRHTEEMNHAADRYERLIGSDERADGAASASIFVPWMAALIVIAIAAAGAILNFQLIARPMAELVGDGARVGGISLAHVAAFTLILLEAATGVVLMEAIGATQLLPVFRRMRGKITTAIGFAAFFFLAVFSTIEVALAFTREAILALDAEVLRAAAGETAGEAAAAEGLPVALIAQALLGATIPWILAIVAIPAETVLNNTRFITEAAWKQSLGLGAFVLAMVGGGLRAISHGAMALYDLLIFPALALEKLLKPAPAPHPDEQEASAERQAAARRRQQFDDGPAGHEELEEPDFDDLDTDDLNGSVYARGGRA
ncbi:MAG: hypothetical protein PVI23_08205 [Maricaulaceae bacterium]|jgi:hypothetical protein